MANMICIRLTNRSIIGEENDPKRPGYKKMQIFLSLRGLVVATFIGIVIVVNLIYDVHRILHLGNPEYAHGMLTFAPLLMGGFFIFMVATMRGK